MPRMFGTSERPPERPTQGMLVTKLHVLPSYLVLKSTPRQTQISIASSPPGTALSTSSSMSSIVLPSRGQCIQITDDSQPCQCQWFFPPESPLLDQLVCGMCGHGIHAHADYFSIIVNHYPANQCAAYAQQTHMMQFCTCGRQLFEHERTFNSYHIPNPWTVLHHFNPDTNAPSPSVTASSYFSDASSPSSSDTTSSDYNTAILSDDSRNMSAPTSSPSTISSTSPAIQPNTTQTIGYSPDGYFTQPSNYIPNSPYAGPSEGDVMNEFEYQDYGSAMHAEPSEDWSGSYHA